ncbi:MAG: sulfatase [Planctomycetota bacterium]
MSVETFGLRMLTAAALAASLGCGGGGSDAGRMNVLIVTLDTTRPDRISCYGGAPGLTPEIDALASEGTRFERAVSTAGITPMSHASILSGLNNYEHGMRVFYSDEVSHQLLDSVDTLPEILGAKGYRTAARVSSYPVSSAYNLDQGFDDFESGVNVDGLDLSRQQRHATAWDTEGFSPTQRRGDHTTTSALQWLDENGEDGPWCMWLHMFDVHDFSLVPPVEFAARFDVEYPTQRVSAGNVQWRERIYDPELAFMDAQIGRIRAWLKEHGQDRNTVIVITADHGQGLTEGKQNHGWMKHRLLYDWSVRVPMIVRAPGVGSGGVIDAQVRTIDVVPTVLELLEVPLKSAVDGRSMVDLMRGEAEDEPRIAYADALNLHDTHSPRKGALPPHQDDNLYMACDGRWKLIWHERNPEHSQLYDLLKDPKELNDVYVPDHPEALRLKAFLDERDAWRIQAPGADSGGPNADALGQLGYGGGEDDDDEPATDDESATGDDPPR